MNETILKMKKDEKEMKKEERKKRKESYISGPLLFENSQWKIIQTFSKGVAKKALCKASFS